MPADFVGLAIEVLVSILLVITISYCWILNKRLMRLKADEMAFKATIGELVSATELAERAIGGLKHAVTECEQALGQRMRAAEVAAGELGSQVGAAQTVLNRIALVTDAARKHSSLSPEMAHPAYVEPHAYYPEPMHAAHYAPEPAYPPQAPAYAPQGYPHPQHRPNPAYAQAQPVYAQPGAQARAASAAAENLAARARMRARGEAA
ncbi:MAG: DUF6468 domain-containing protein [Labrys sp. (in: a-proteobacteria)]